MGETPPSRVRVYIIVTNSNCQQHDVGKRIRTANERPTELERRQRSKETEKLNDMWLLILLDAFFLFVLLRKAFFGACTRLGAN